MAIYEKVRGTIETLFQLGLGGPQWKANAGVVEARDSADSAFVVVRAAAPPKSLGTGSDSDVVTQRDQQRTFRRSFLLMGG